MGAGYVHECDQCGYSIHTSGPWEFYRDSEGNRKPYGHPKPSSEEARRRGIWGFSAILYCPKCDKTYDIVLNEFRFKEEKAVKCPECGSTSLLCAACGDTGITCPRCGKGNLVGMMEYIS